MALMKTSYITSKQGEKMRKFRLITYLLIVLAFLLAACTSTTTSTSIDVSTNTAEQAATSMPQEAVSNVSAPAGGNMGNPPPGAGTGSASAEAGLSTAAGAYSLDGGTDTQSNQTYAASTTDQSGVNVTNAGTLTLSNVTINTSGNTSSDENSSFYGLNAGVLAASGSRITMNGGSISTTGTGANGAFATGEGTTVNLSDVTITAIGDGGHGVMATLDGVMNLADVDMTTSGAHSAPIATDRGGGMINATGGTLITSGQDSPCYYSTGTLTIKNSTCNATGSEAAVIEGANTINIMDSSLTTSVPSKWGVMIYQSFSGDAQGSNGIFTMTGGSLSYTDAGSPLFYVTNTTGNINLKSVDVSTTSGILVQAEGNDRWGTSGSNGGTVVFTADTQTLRGDLAADRISSITATLQNGSSLTGAINKDNTAKKINLTLDSSSTWTVTADSYLSCLANPDGTAGRSISNIIGNGHTVYYNASQCASLGSQTYKLNGGGTLTPMN
jgi:predicted small secreted protein